MRFLLAAALLSLSLPALADPTPSKPAPDARAMHEGDCARARAQKKTCVIDMGKGDDIDGTTPKIGDINVAVAAIHKDGSLIRIRRDFITEILKTAEDL